MPASVSPKLPVQPPEPSNLARERQSGVMVSGLGPLPVSEGGLKLHVLSRGNLEHDAAKKLWCRRSRVYIGIRRKSGPKIRSVPELLRVMRRPNSPPPKSAHMQST